MRYGLILMAAVLVGCSSPPPKVSPIPERISGAYQPTGQERAQVYQRTYTYWSALAAKDWRRAYEFHTDGFRARNPFTTWQRRQAAAPLVNPKPVALHWTKGAHRHQGPELYAIVTWKDDTKRSGRLTWRQDDEVFWIEK